MASKTLFVQKSEVIESYDSIPKSGVIKSSDSITSITLFVPKSGVTQNKKSYLCVEPSEMHTFPSDTKFIMDECYCPVRYYTLRPRDKN